MTARTARIAALLVVVAGICACGEGTLTFGGDRSDDRAGDNITVTGNIRDILVDNALRDVVVFVYTNLQLAEQDQRLPFPSNSFDSLRTTIVRADGDRTFRLDDARRGSLTIVFLQDKAVDPDGSIDCDDVTVPTERSLDCPALPTPSTTTTAASGNCPVPADDNAVAVLIKANKLSNVRGGSTVDLRDVDLDFPCAQAEAQEIVTTITRPRPDGSEEEPQ